MNLSLAKLLVRFISESAADRFGRVIRSGFDDGKITLKDVIKYFRDRGWKTLCIYLAIHIYVKSKYRKQHIAENENRNSRYATKLFKQHKKNFQGVYGQFQNRLRS